MPAYNVAAYVGQCLDSLFAQEFTDFEIIAVDDCSTDATWDILLAYSQVDERLRVFRNETRIFAGGSRNRGLAESRGEFIALQDADDLSEPTRIATQFDYLDREPVDFVSSGFYTFDEMGRRSLRVPKAHLPTKAQFLEGPPFCHAATMFRRECLNAVGGYRTSAETRRGQDYDLFMRLYIAGYQGANLRDVLYGYRVNAETLARRTFKYRLDECKIRWRGFTGLGLMPLGALFAIKPLFSHLLHLLRRA